MKVVIIEFIDEFNAFFSFIDKKGLSLNDFTIVALEPRLQAYLKKQGISYRTTLPYFNNESHKKIIIETEKVMKYIHENFKFTDGNGLKNCYVTEFAHHIRLYLNHMFKMLEILENMYRENNKCEIFAYINNRTTSSCMINDTERYVGALAESFAKKRNLKFTNFNGNNISHEFQKTNIKSWKAIEKVVVRAMLFLLRKKRLVFIPRAGNVFNKVIVQLSRKDKRKVFLAIDYTGGLLKLVAFNLLSYFRSLFGRNFPRYYLVNINFIHEAVDEKEQTGLMGEIDSIDSQNGFLYEYNDVNYLELIRKKINAGLKVYMSNMLLQSYNLKYLFERFEKGIIMSYSALGIMSVAGELSRKMGIKSLFVSHGAHPVPVDLCHEMELVNLCRGFMLSDYTHMALSTPVQESHLHYFKNKYEWVKNSELKTGPLIFANLNGTDKSLYKTKLGFSPDNVILTHAVTTKARHGERFYFLETMDEFISSLTDIIHVIEQIKNTRLIIRIHPGFYLTNDEIKTLLPVSDKFIIHREGQFAEVLAATDILISYSSTTMDEAFLNRIPVLLYDKWNRYNHFKTGVFDNPQSPDIFPVCYINDRAKLATALQYLIKKIKEIKKEDINVEKYCYNEDYSSNFYEFIEESFK